MYGYARGMQGRLGFCGSYSADVGLRLVILIHWELPLLFLGEVHNCISAQATETECLDLCKARGTIQQ